MKSLFCSFLLAATASSFALAAETKPTPPAAAAPAVKASLVGKYAGTWQSGDGAAGGKLKVAVKAEGDKWTAEASFTYQDAEIPTKLKSMKVEGAKVELVFEWAVDGNTNASTMRGELTGDKLQGTYESLDGGRGSWIVTRT